MPRKTLALVHEEITRERWLRGRLDYKLHEGQRDLKKAFLEKSRGQIFVNECGRQFGKTYFWVIAALEYGIANPRSRIKIGTAFQTDLIEFIIPAFDAVLQDCPEDLLPRFLGYRSKYILHTDSEIKLVGLDKKPNGMRGNVIDLIIIDEAGFTDKLEYLYKSVIIPATTHRPNCRVVMSSSTPRDLNHPFLEFVQKAEIENAYIVKTIHDNPMVDEETILRLSYEMGGVDSEEWQREYLCQRIREQALTIVPEWKDEYIEETSHDAYYPFYHKYVAMDLGVRDHTAVIFGYYDFLRSTLIIEDEFIMNGPQMTTDLLQKEIKLKETVNLYSKVYLRVSDNNNPLLLQDLSYTYGIHFIPTDKGSLDEMINAVRILTGRGQIIVHPKCQQLLGSLRYGVWDNKRANFSHSKIYGHFDALAALVYLVRNLNKVTNPIPVNFQLDTDNQILLKSERDNETASMLKRAFGLKKR